MKKYLYYYFLILVLIGIVYTNELDLSTTFTTDRKVQENKLSSITTMATYEFIKMRSFKSGGWRSFIRPIAYSS